MATIKSYTTIEQSRKLAEILPLESADMFYDGVQDLYKKKVYNIPLNGSSITVRTGHIITKEGIKVNLLLPCWSLAALLDVLPDELEDNHFLTLQKEKNEYCCCYEGLNNSFRHNTFADNPIDACYEMIIKLHELNLL